MIREQFSIENMVSILKKYSTDSIEVSPHYIEYISKGKRDISVVEIKDYLLNKNFYFVEKQVNGWVRYKLVYEISNKYDLVIVVKEEIRKILKVVSAYKTNKKLKEKWKKISKSLMMK